MCPLTSYPIAVPLKFITAKDNYSESARTTIYCKRNPQNHFISNLAYLQRYIAEELNITHVNSTAYHQDSQDVLEIIPSDFFISMLKLFCLQHG